MARYSFFVTLLSFVLIFVWFVSMTFVENRFDVSFLLLEIERICQLTKFHQNLAPAIATFIKKARTFHPGVLFQSFSFFRITEKKKEGGKPISSSSTFISFPYEIANHGRSVIACPLSLSLWNDIRLARGQKKSEDKALSSSSDLPEIARQLPCTAKSAICFPWYLPQPSLDPFETWIQTFFLKITSKILIYIYTDER